MTELIPLIKEGGFVLFALYSVDRMRRMETELKGIRTENSRQAKLLERVCSAYESARKLLIRLATINRKGGKLHEADLREMESIPDLTTLLNSPLDAK